MSNSIKHDDKMVLNYGAKLLSWVSGLTSLSMGIIMVHSFSLLKTLNHDISWLATLRVSGEVGGYFARILAGFITEKSRKNLRILLLVGYTAPLIFKIMFFLAIVDWFPIPVRCILFGSANILDKIFNVWRDIPRDVAVVELTPPNNLKQTVAFRKFMANFGTAIGGLTIITLNFLKPNFGFLVKYELWIVFTIAFIPSILSSLLLYYNSYIYDEVVIKNDYNKNHSQYNIFDKFTVFIVIIITIIILFLGKVNEMYIFNTIKNLNYNTEFLYVLFYLLSPISLLITYKNKNIKSFSLLFGSIILVIASVLLVICYTNLTTIVLVCLSYSVYTSTLDTVLFSSVVNRFKHAKYNAMLLAIINISMGIGSLCSMSLIQCAQSVYNNQISLLFSLIPVFLGLILLISNKKNLFK